MTLVRSLLMRCVAGFIHCPSASTTVKPSGKCGVTTPAAKSVHACSVTDPRPKNNWYSSIGAPPRRPQGSCGGVQPASAKAQTASTRMLAHHTRRTPQNSGKPSGTPSIVFCHAIG